jgi:hypothetical protein
MEHAIGEGHVATVFGRPRGNAACGAAARSTTAQQGELGSVAPPFGGVRSS